MTDATVTAQREPDELERILRTLRARIVNQELPPGTRLREQELAAAFGVPRSRIRDVLLLLAERRLVDREPNRGAVVRRLGLAELTQILEAREALEGLCARLATENVPPESWQDLADLFGAPTEALVESGDLEGYIEHNRRVRSRLLEAAGSQVLRELLVPLFERTAVVTRRLILATNRARDGMLQHRAVLAAMRRGDAGEAERLKRLQIRSVRDDLAQFHRFVL